MRYLLDTNHLGIAVSEVPRLRLLIRDHHQQGHRFGTILPVLCELQCGLLGADDPEDAQRRLDAFFEEHRIWPMEYIDTHAYGRLYRDLRSRGRVLSQVDIMLAAVVMRMKAILLTTDRDFEALPEVPTENWLAEPKSEA